MKKLMPCLMAATLCLLLMALPALAAETSSYDADGIEGIVDIEEDDHAQILVSGVIENEGISLEYHLSGGTRLELVSDEAGYRILSAGAHPGVEISLRVYGRGRTEDAAEGRAEDTLSVFVHDVENEVFQSATAVPGDDAPYISHIYTVAEDDTEFEIGASLLSVRLAEDGSVLESVDLLLSIRYTVTLDEGGVGGVSSAEKPSDEASAPPANESTSVAPGVGEAREAADNSADGGHPPREESSYIPDGAKDDSFLYLVLGLVLFLAVVAVVVIIVRMMRKNRRHESAAINTEQRPSVRNACPACGAAVSPADQFCETCGNRML